MPLHILSFIISSQIVTERLGGGGGQNVGKKTKPKLISQTSFISILLIRK